MKTNSLHKSLSLILFSFFVSTSTFSQIFVDIDASSGGNGSSWATAYDDLQTALAGATGGDVLWVAEGIYTISTGEDDSFEIPSGVALYGGFDGTEANLVDRDWENNVTSLDGQTYTNTLVYFENSSNTTILDGFTIEKGDADGINQRGQSAGAIFMDIVGIGTECNPQILNCIISNNEADKGGGAVYIDGSYIGIAAPYFENCLFENNYSLSDGGAVYANGIQSGAVNATYFKCTFKNNHSVGSGAGLFNHGGHGDVSSIFTKCNFESNVAEGNGGAMYSLGTSDGKANHTISNCRFYANTGFAAGAIYNNGGNTNGDASPTITNCTFYLNEATGSGGTGGAIYNNGDGGGQSNTQIINCIIWGNIAPYGTHVIKNVHCSPTISYCLVDATDCSELNNGTGSNITCGSDLIYELGHDPDFIDAANGNLRIGDNSDARNTGSNSGNIESEDLDGNNRLVGIIDMGTYENSLAPLPVELFRFVAYPKGRKVILEWATLSEQDNKSFIVEKSADNRVFTEIAEIRGAGNADELNNYEAVDATPYEGNNYYRLKIVSYSGEVEYSDISVVRFSKNEVVIYPNPVSNEIQIAFNESVIGDANFEIFSIYGQLIYNGNLSIDSEISRINISSLDLKAGTYILSIQLSANQQLHKRFQKIN
ncbi:MAG: putative outer membrane repeat protein [Saprospiraceae bacterium]|jgi:predicted outer membrane repeat protein